MKTNKLFVVILALILTMSMTATAFADDADPRKVTISSIENGSNQASIPVTGTFNYTGDSGATVYSVDVAWGAMSFTYTVSSDGVWQPTSHTYTASTSEGGVWAASGNDITVTNHSNASVKAAFAFSSDNISTSKDVSGSFYENANGSGNAKTEFTLESAVGKTYAEAYNNTTYLFLSGALDKDHTANTKIGTVTVTLSAA